MPFSLSFAQSFLQSAALSCSRGMVSAALRYLDGVGPDERDEEKAVQLLLGAEEQVRPVCTDVCVCVGVFGVSLVWMSFSLGVCLGLKGIMFLWLSY